MRELKKSDLDKDLEGMRTETVPFDIDYIDTLMVNIQSAPSYLFRHHARDFLVGTICQEKQSLLITYNKRHFNWLPTEIVFTPEEYLQFTIELE